MSMKNPLALAGIELATFRFVAQHLNQCATAVPHLLKERSLMVQLQNFDELALNQQKIIHLFMQ